MYTNENGFVPRSFDEILESLMDKINEQYKEDYSVDTFRGTNMYRFCYPIIQEIMESENRFAEIYVKLEDFIKESNEKILIPKTPKIGLIDTFKENGFTISVRDNTEENAGKLGVCVLLKDTDDDYQENKEKVLDILCKYTIASDWYDGDQVGIKRLSNGQNFQYAFYLPNYIHIVVRLYITISDNTNIVVDTPVVIKEKLVNNIKKLYSLGVNFEPEKYFNIQTDAPYASKVLIQYSIDEGKNWIEEVYSADFRDYIDIGIDDIEVIINNA